MILTITQAGLARETDALTTGNMPKFDKLVIGSGAPNATPFLATAMVQSAFETQVIVVERLSAGVVKFHASIPSDIEVNIREIGLLLEDGTLYAYADYSQGTGQSFFKGTGFAFSFFVLLTREQLPNLVFTYVPVDTASIALTISQNASSAIDLHIQDYLLNQYTAADVLAKIKTVDGADSGLDADLLDGLNSTYFQQKLDNTDNIELGKSLTGERNSYIDLHSSGGLDYSARLIRTLGVNGDFQLVQTGTGNIDIYGGSSFLRDGHTVWHAGNDGASSGLDADLLDGQQGSYYLPAASYTASDVLAKIKTVDGASSGLDADLLDGSQGADYAKLASPSLTGVPTAPTAAVATNTTQIATTAFVEAATTPSQLLTDIKTVDGANSGLDADLLRGLPADFTASKAVNGYQKLPSGLIIQWGNCASETVVSMPIAFPTAKLMSIGTHVGAEVATIITDLNYAHNLSQCKFLDNYGSSSVDVYWIAIGY